MAFSRFAVFFMLRRTPLHAIGQSPVSVLKREIQRLLRQTVIKRDKGCFIRSLRHCNGTPGNAVLQADHLITRASNATFANPNLVVCVCKGCHLWKKMNKEEYDRVVRSLLPENIVSLWKRAEADRYRPTRKGAYDWKLEVVALKQQLARMA